MPATCFKRSEPCQLLLYESFCVFHKNQLYWIGAALQRVLQIQKYKKLFGSQNYIIISCFAIIFLPVTYGLLDGRLYAYILLSSSLLDNIFSTLECSVRHFYFKSCEVNIKRWNQFLGKKLFWKFFSQYCIMDFDKSMIL